MKLRRTMALAAATAVIAPVALLSAPAAFATGTTPTDSPAVTSPENASPSATVTPSDSASASVSAAPETEKETETVTTTSPSASASTSTSPSPSQSESTSPSPSATDTEDPEDEVTPQCEPAPLDLSIKGLAGKIARGSGWHTFTFNVYNDSKTTVKNVMFFAGASADKNGDQLFSTKQVRLQALNEDTGAWENLSEEGVAVGIVGATDKIKPGYEVDISLRINVKKSAPVGAGFSLGGGLVFGEDAEVEPCFTDVAYKFQIVEAGGEDDTKPQEGGKIPVPAEKPAANTPQVTGSLAETGSSSATPMFALAGGAAIVLGAGAMFVVRRRKNGDATA